jgi:hypothetical protein
MGSRISNSPNRRRHAIQGLHASSRINQSRGVNPWKKAIAEQDRSKMLDKTKSAESSAVSGLEPKTEINLIRGFKATKRVIPRASENGVHVLHPGTASMHLLS